MFLNQIKMKLVSTSLFTTIAGVMPTDGRGCHLIYSPLDYGEIKEIFKGFNISRCLVITSFSIN